MKQCSKCGLVLPLSEFQVRSVEKGTYRGVCRSCRRAYDAAYYQRNSEKYKEYRRTHQPMYRSQRRQQLLDYLRDKHCIDCGETDLVVLELDHVSGRKHRNIGDMISGYGWERILEEIRKCEVRCANCHRRKTARDFKWFRGDFGA